MDEFIVEINRTLTFQMMNRKLRYKPDDPYIRTVVIGIRPKDSTSENDWIAYIECMFWNIADQKETTFWNYALEYEKDQEDKPFGSICRYLKKKSSSKSLLSNKKVMSGWAVYIPEFVVYDDIFSQYQTTNLDYEDLKSEILGAIPSVLQYSFFIKPSYIFISDRDIHPGALEANEYKKLGSVGEASVYIKIC